MTRPTAEKLHGLLEQVASDTGVSVETICSKDASPQAKLARRRFMTLCRRARASHQAISRALGGALSNSRIHQMLSGLDCSDDPLPGEDVVTLILEEIAADSGIPAQEIQADGSRPAVRAARRHVVQRAAGAGVSTAAIARVMGGTADRIARQVERVNVWELPPHALEPFRRKGEFVPLTREDYALRAAVSMAEAIRTLERLAVVGAVTVTAVPKFAGLKVYEVAADRRGP
ncbi:MULTISPECIES: hypothetical protein [unclassified Paracoccus (in: a-proteobacteria)]|uniref:hypothetical protein n=1 Tax=unclassified Paracoccus (in: a-proteobacteria) TaxID=2688777 RepID=UPI0012B24412|nr:MULTISPECIES: hypothetical protein [unclassified Paracoccus (in: a-proteobacteria)]UXU73687.1 hypothetical protein GB879_006970 [Paracoccus sp. SMMA_5]UXU79576.1 hypothetical protein GB880_006955 [Paracoccus sp. SMMA_5_TC]